MYELRTDVSSVATVANPAVIDGDFRMLYALIDAIAGSAGPIAVRGRAPRRLPGAAEAAPPRPVGTDKLLPTRSARQVASGAAQDTPESPMPNPPARTKASTAALICSGSFGHAATISAKPGSGGLFWPFSVPDSVPRVSEISVFDIAKAICSSPLRRISPKPRRTKELCENQSCPIRLGKWGAAPGWVRSEGA